MIGVLVVEYVSFEVVVVVLLKLDVCVEVNVYMICNEIFVVGGFDIVIYVMLFDVFVWVIEYVLMSCDLVVFDVFVDMFGDMCMLMFGNLIYCEYYGE